MIFVRLIFVIVTWALAETSLSERYPNRLITPDYGIVTADDLAYDVTQRDAVPYDPDKEWLTRYWQCLPIKGIRPKYRTWRADHTSYSFRTITLCDLEIHVNGRDGRQIYSDRRAQPNQYCRDFDKQWRRLTKGEPIVCFNGDWGIYESDKIDGKYKSWTWNKIKTRKGCYSYFGDCYVKGCARGRCPNNSNH